MYGSPFSSRCLVQWLEQKNSCPMCKASVQRRYDETTGLVHGGAVSHVWHQLSFVVKAGDINFSVQKHWTTCIWITCLRAFQLTCEACIPCENLGSGNDIIIQCIWVLCHDYFFGITFVTLIDFSVLRVWHWSSGLCVWHWLILQCYMCDTDWFFSVTCVALIDSLQCYVCDIDLFHSSVLHVWHRLILQCYVCDTDWFFSVTCVTLIWLILQCYMCDTDWFFSVMCVALIDSSVLHVWHWFFSVTCVALIDSSVLCVWHYFFSVTCVTLIDSSVFYMCGTDWFVLCVWHWLILLCYMCNTDWIFSVTNVTLSGSSLVCNIDWLIDFQCVSLIDSFPALCVWHWLINFQHYVCDTDWFSSVTCPWINPCLGDFTIGH
jgi:hypothetical protein